MWIDDQVIERCQQAVSTEVWVPSETIVVLGSSNNPQRECHVEHCEEDGIPILKRRGGGGAVVLHTGVVVLSVGAWVKDRFNNADFFSRINASVIDTIKEKSPALENMSQRGISDLAIFDRKIAGTSLFRSRNYLLYQASILVDSKVELFERYLRHPSLEPEYRKRKKHRDFVMGLGDIDTSLSSSGVAGTLEQGFLRHFEVALASQLSEPVEEQCPHLLNRLEKTRYI